METLPPTHLPSHGNLSIYAAAPLITLHIFRQLFLIGINQLLALSTNSGISMVPQLTQLKEVILGLTGIFN